MGVDRVTFAKLLDCWLVWSVSANVSGKGADEKTKIKVVITVVVMQSLFFLKERPLCEITFCYLAYIILAMRHLVKEISLFPAEHVL